MAKAHTPGFLKIAADAKTRIRECTVAEVTAKRAAGETVEGVNTVYPNVYDGVEGMLFITKTVESSQRNGAWVPFRHPKSR